MRHVFVPFFALLFALFGCDSPRSRFPDGTQLFDRTNHQFFGKVIGYDAYHDFHNGTSPGPAILIEPADASHGKLWGSCTTCAASFELKAP